MNDWNVLLIFISKLPVYLYVIYRAWKLRHALIIISANWLGALAVFGALASISVIYLPRLLAGVVAYGVVLSLFMLAYTASEIREGKYEEADK